MTQKNVLRVCFPAMIQSRRINLREVTITALIQGYLAGHRCKAPIDGRAPAPRLIWQRGVADWLKQRDKLKDTLG